VGECPRRASEVGVRPERLVQRQGGAVLHALGEIAPRQRPLRHQPVQVRLGARELPVGRRQCEQRIRRARRRPLEGVGELGEPLGDDGRFDRGLVGEVFVQGWRANAQPVGETAHRQALEALLLEDLAGGSDDLRRTWAERLA
jgi:hypothetical protein